ncbi:hypothetical protein M0R72_14775 [Candidatus Pacearchaeota archaeon]|jgi:hypothetical protein|nr:hypothetical protein [Candidatus Pacearchaeota archaeon]
MQVTRQEIVALAENLGYKTANKWNKARMEEKLLTIAQLDPEGEEAEDLENEDQKKLLAMIVKNKGVVEIVKEKVDDNEVAPKVGDEGETKTAEELNAEINKAIPGKKAGKKLEGKVKSMSRLESAFLTVKGVSKTNVTQLIEKSNQLYVKNGGSDNLKESKWAINIALTAGVCFGLINVAGEVVSPASVE